MPKHAYKCTPAVVDEICDRVSGGEKLTDVCRDAHLPSRTQVYQWIACDPGDDENLIALQARWPTVMRAYAMAMADDALDIADDGRNDFVERARENGDTYVVADHEHISRSKLRVDTRFRLMEKFAPDVFAPQMSLGGTLKVESGAELEVVRRLAFVLASRAAIAGSVVDDDESA